MRTKNLLIRILRDLAGLIAEEASRNQDFADRLEKVLAEVPRGTKPRRSIVKHPDVPDIFAEAKARTADNFELWLANLEVPVLKALVRKHDLDSSKRTSKWKEPEKFAKFIAEAIRSRIQRGAAFLSS